MIITDSREKIKVFMARLLPHEGAIFAVALVIVGSLLGLGVWRLANIDRDLEPIMIERGLDFPRLYALDAGQAPVGDQIVRGAKNNLIAKNQVAQVSSVGKIVASQNGTKYYFTHCSGVKRIKEVNKIYFDSEPEAISAGYTKAKNCN